MPLKQAALVNGRCERRVLNAYILENQMSTLTEASLAINSLFCETNTEERIYLKHIYSLAYGQNQLNKVII